MSDYAVTNEPLECSDVPLVIQPLLVSTTGRRCGFILDRAVFAREELLKPHKGVWSGGWG